MLRALIIGWMASGFLYSTAQADPSAYYNIQDYGAGVGSNGPDVGTHHVSGSDGTIRVSLVGGGDPSVEVEGSTVDGSAAYLYGRADYDYHITLNASTAGVGDALYRASQSGGVSEIVGYLSGSLQVASTQNSQVTASLSATGYSGGDIIYASCAGYYCYSAAPGFAYNTLVPITLAVHLYDFDFACATNPNTGVLEGDCSTAKTTVGLRVSASLMNQPGLSAGSVYASIDPTFTLDSDFLRTNGLGANSLTIGQDSISAVPEPTSWAMMLIGFVVLGGVLRRSHGVGAPKSKLVPECNLLVDRRLFHSAN